MSGYLVKLVRDRIGDRLPPARVRYAPVVPEERERLLRAKLIEEAVEYVTAPSIGELADVLEVVRALAECHAERGRGRLLLEEAAVAKRAERGGFERGVGLYAEDVEP